MAMAGSPSIGSIRTQAPSKFEVEASQRSRLPKLSHPQRSYLPKLQIHTNGGVVLGHRRKQGVQATSARVAKQIGTSSAKLNKHGKIEKPILVIDNYDSFTYNLCQYLGDLGAEFEVFRNDELTVKELKGRNPRGILISPGPGTPQDSGKIVRSPYGVMHGKKSLVYYDEKGENGLLAGLPNPFTAGRYHSLVIEKESFPHKELEITAWTEDGLIMGVRHKKYKHIQAVQFHPESIITFEGRKIVQNFIDMLECLDIQDVL